MRRIALVFEDSDFEALKSEKEKSGLPWEKYILDRCLGRNKSMGERNGGSKRQAH
jgi:predicted DNA binding CopG/RHH family protein